MKKCFGLAIIFLFLYSCEKSTEFEEELPNSQIKVTALYSDDFQKNVEKIDVNAKVYIYYGLESYHQLEMKYLYDGLILYHTDTIKPHSIDTIGPLGYVLIDPDFSEDYVTVGVESNFHKGKFGINPFILKREVPIILTVINKP